MDWMRSVWSRERPERVAGLPQSGNGASSFHLWWDVPVGERYTAASVTVEVMRRPDIDRLVFFAMQVAFIRPGGGGAHLGLQHNPRFPGWSAANWGGYDPHGGLLQGTESPLPSTPDDPNTRDFDWRGSVPYRLTITRGDERSDGWFAWRGSVTDTLTGNETVVRYLYSAGKYLRAPVVWTESFARCDDPVCEVRWSDAALVSEGGETHAVTMMRIDYQTFAAGGCTNTNTVVDGSSFVQTTGQPRTTKPGESLSII